MGVKCKTFPCCFRFTGSSCFSLWVIRFLLLADHRFPPQWPLDLQTPVRPDGVPCAFSGQTCPFSEVGRAQGIAGEGEPGFVRTFAHARPAACTPGRAHRPRIPPPPPARLRWAGAAKNIQLCFPSPLQPGPMSEALAPGVGQRILSLF